MQGYLFEVRDSDGNDCTVFDAVVAAESREQATEILWKHLTETYPDDESDGGFGDVPRVRLCLRAFRGQRSDAWNGRVVRPGQILGVSITAFDGRSYLDVS